MPRAKKQKGIGWEAGLTRAYARSERGSERLAQLLALCLDAARAQGATEVGAHADNGNFLMGLAGTSLGRLLEAAEAGGVSHVVASHLGAFGEQPERVQAVVGRLLATGVVVETLRDGRLSEATAYFMSFGDLREPGAPRGR